MCFGSPKVDTTIQEQQLEEARLARQREEERTARIQEGYLQIINSDKEYLYIKSLGLIDVHIKEHRVNETFNENFHDIVQYRDINYGK
jgi:hypothetical protein